MTFAYDNDIAQREKKFNPFVINLVLKFSNSSERVFLQVIIVSCFTSKAIRAIKENKPRIFITFVENV